jgi:prepilin-type N-terminal cleavage/methylation domain-containing protein
MTHDTLRRRRSSGGFTLIEVMLTLVILAFGMLTLAVMQLYAMRQGSQGRHTGDGATIGRSYLEQAARLPWASLTAVAGNGWQTPGWVGLPAAAVTVDRPGGLGAATEHAYTVQWRVTNVGVLAPICLRDVEVRVTWSEEETSASKELILGTRRYNQGDDEC